MEGIDIARDNKDEEDFACGSISISRPVVLFYLFLPLLIEHMLGTTFVYP
jgi:hypothetical protein